MKSSEPSKCINLKAVVPLGLAINSIKEEEKFEWDVVCGLPTVGHSEFKFK